MNDMKVCTNTKCKHKGFPQKRERFHRNSKKEDWRADRCKDCCRLANQIAYAKTLVKPTEMKKAVSDTVFLINDVEYKIGSHGFVFLKCEREWVKSELTSKELNHMIWTNPNEAN